MGQESMALLTEKNKNVISIQFDSIQSIDVIIYQSVMTLNSIVYK